MGFFFFFSQILYLSINEQRNKLSLYEPFQGFLFFLFFFLSFIAQLDDSKITFMYKNKQLFFIIIMFLK